MAFPPQYDGMFMLDRTFQYLQPIEYPPESVRSEPENASFWPDYPYFNREIVGDPDQTLLDIYASPATAENIAPAPPWYGTPGAAARLCFTVPEAGFELLASSPPYLSGDVQASLSHAHFQDGHRTDGSAFLDKHRHELPDTSAVFVAPEDLFIDSSNGVEQAEPKQIVGKMDPFRHRPAEGRAERAIELLQPRRTRKSPRQREGAVVKPVRVKERRRHVRKRSGDAQGQLHVHFEEVQQL